jgi:hypothetical protein
VSPRISASVVAFLGHGCAAIAAALLLFAVLERMDRPVVGFQAYYTAAHLVAERQPIARFYDDEWFNEQVQRNEPALHEIYNVNLPTTALAFVPLAAFQTHEYARLAWTVLAVPLLIVFIEALAAIAGIGAAAKPFWYAGILLSEPIRANLLQGQAYLVVAIGLLLVLRWWRNRADSLAGAALAAVLLFKSAGTMLWPVLAIAGRWRLLTWASLIIAVTVVVSWPFVGADGWLAYLHAVAALPRSEFIRVTAYQSVPSLLQHLLSGNSTPGLPIVQLQPAVLRMVVLAAVIALIAVTFIAARRRPDDELTVGAAILLTVIATPIAEVHAYTVTLIPAAMLVRRLGGTHRDWKSLALWIGVAMIAVPTPYRSLHLVNGWLAVLAYPKLYGGLVLWLLAVLLLLRDDPLPGVGSGMPAIRCR